MLDAVRFCLMDRHVLQRLHDRLSLCPLKADVSEALCYHQQEMLQPVLQSPRTQPRSTLHCILGFGGRFSSSSYMNTENLFQVFHPSWGGWRMLPASQSPRMSNQGIAVLNNFAYLIGGDKNTNGCQAESRCWRSQEFLSSFQMKQAKIHCSSSTQGRLTCVSPGTTPATTAGAASSPCSSGAPITASACWTTTSMPSGGGTTAASWTRWSVMTPKQTRGSSFAPWRDR